MNACASRPCLNGGSCRAAGNEYTCRCLVAWTGTRCETGNSQNHHCLVMKQRTRVSVRPWIAFYGVPWSSIFLYHDSELDAKFIMANVDNIELTKLLLTISHCWVICIWHTRINVYRSPVIIVKNICPFGIVVTLIYTFGLFGSRLKLWSSYLVR